MSYNLTRVLDAANPADFVCESSLVSNDFLVYGLLVLLWVVVYVWIMRRGNSTHTALPLTQFFVSLVATLFWAIRCTENMLPGWFVLVMWVTLGLFVFNRAVLSE